jgi:hypothetical protein
VCFLRPVQQRDATGHCFFAYPLFSRPEGEGEGGAGGDDDGAARRKKALFKVSTDEDVDCDHEIEKCDTDTDKPRELVPFSDYFVAMKHASAGSGLDQEPDLDLDLDLEEECSAEGAGLQGGGRPELPADWEAVSNSFGRQALGCMLGAKSMPQMCRSYPVAPELSQADFWHVRTSFWRKGYVDVEYDAAAAAAVRGREGGREGERRPPPAPGWQAEEHYMVLRTAGCEGFQLAEQEVGITISDCSRF